MDDRPRYMISVAADLVGMHPQTLRIYEARGLVRPKRTAGNTRLYSERDLERLQLIQRLTTELGLNLAGVEQVLALQDELQRLQARIEPARARVARPGRPGPPSVPARARALPACAAPRNEENVVPLPAIHVRLWPAITRRAAASSVAPIASTIGAPCVLASLGARDPEAGRHHWKGH